MPYVSASRLLVVAMASLASALVRAQEPRPAPTGGAALERPPAHSSPTVVLPVGSVRTAAPEDALGGFRLGQAGGVPPGEVVIVTRDEILASGLTNLGDYLQQLPFQAGAMNGNVNLGGEGQTAVSLRNLGAMRTLVLVDGRRLVASLGPTTALADLSTIPVAAVDHVEVLLESASALYGSDAVAGVVNVVTRRWSKGVEVSAYEGLTSRGDGRQQSLEAAVGAGNDRGGFLVGLELDRRASVVSGDRAWAASTLRFDYATGTVRRVQSVTSPYASVTIDPASCPTPLCQALVGRYGAGRATFVHDPSAPDGWRLRQDSDLYDLQSARDLVTPLTRASVFGSGDHRLGDRTRAYFRGGITIESWRNRDSPPVFYGVSAPLDAANFYNPFGVEVSSYRRLMTEMPDASTEVDTTTYRATLGLEGRLPGGDGFLSAWQWDASLAYGRSAGTSAVPAGPYPLAAAFGPTWVDEGHGVHCGTDAAHEVADCFPVDILAPANHVYQLAELGYVTDWRDLDAESWSADVTLGRPLFELAAGRPASLAVGYEYLSQSRSRSLKGTPVPCGFCSADYYGLPPPSASRASHEGFGEIEVPVLGGLPLVHDLTLSGAGRLARFEVYGNLWACSLGARWSPVRDVSVRGSFGTGFRVPTFDELGAPIAIAFSAARDPCAAPADPVVAAQCADAANNGNEDTYVPQRTGGNANLEPETSKSFTAGVVLHPSFLEGFVATADLYDVRIDETIGLLDPALVLHACYPGPGKTPNAVLCALVHRDYTGHEIVYIDGLLMNLGTLHTRGIDVSARYARPTPVGTFGAGILADYLLALDRGDLAEGKGNYDLGLNPTLKLNASLDYSHAGLRIAARARYLGGLRECAGPSGTSLGGKCYAHYADPAGTPYPSREIGAYTKVDLQAAYALPWAAGKTTLTVGVQNVTDAKPPVIYSSALGFADTDYDFRGRFGYAMLAHEI